MDINSLLSPQDATAPRPASSASATPTNNAAPRKRPGRPPGGKRVASALSQEVLMSPSPEAPRSAPALSHDAVVQAQQQAQSTMFSPAHSNGSELMTPRPALETPTSEARSPFGTPQHLRPSLQNLDRRHSSTSEMDTLADLASMQQLQPNNSNVNHAQRSPSMAARPTPNNRSLSTLSSSDLAMAEAPAQTPPPRVFTATSLSEDDLNTITELTSYLAEKSYAYESHVQLIAMLHQGFVSHVYPDDCDKQQAQDPHGYSLLSDLRQARDAMLSRFAVGEDIWRDWIQDESLLATSSEDRQTVMELCMRAVQEEPASVVLWQLYGEWVWTTYAVANGFAEENAKQWTTEDKMICQAIFTRELVLDVWEQAVNATKWRIDNSHRIWDRYVELIMQDFPEVPLPQTIEEIRTIYMMRLTVPHATWEATSQAFWPIISKYDSEGWEEIMSATNEMAGPAKQQYGLREPHELAVKRAGEAGDKSALYSAFFEYMRWERKHKPRQRSSFDVELRTTLFERALLRFPTTIEWWLDYTDFLISSNPSNPAILPVLERATRHCPWAGDLWSRRILRTELESKTYQEVESVKHKATNSGLLDLGGMEEMLKVYATWCGYLRRRAFHSDNNDDDIDMADMGIAGVIEDVQVAGKKLYGAEFKGDPLWRIEKVHIKFLTEARRTVETREVWRRLVPTLASSYDFWTRYYNWELLMWGFERLTDALRVETPENGPRLATAVLREASMQKNLDWPEKVLETYAYHVQTHEAPDVLQKAEVEIRNLNRQLQMKRAREAAEAAEAAAAAPQPEQGASATLSEDSPNTVKRKRDDELAQDLDVAAKRNKVAESEVVSAAHEASSSASAQVKRDREHNTITVKNLPADITELRIRQYFADCGNVISASILADADAMTATATVEFESSEDIPAAKTRDGKTIDGNPIKIQSGSLTTLYVTNYPPDFDEVKIRELFQDFGSIVGVRFPSLKYNQRRRFCYVQFLTTQEARAATTLNDKALDGQHRLVALISDPEARKSRQGATAEGRELHVGNVEHGAHEDEIKEFFQQHGVVENVRMIKGANGKFTGTVFIIYSNTDEANAALALNNKPLQSRLLRVSLATDKSSRDANNERKGGSTIIRDPAAGSPAPESSAGSPLAGDATNGRRGFLEANVPITAGNGASEDTGKTKRERSIALLNVPDTVNDARIRSLFEPYGALRKIMVRRDKGGALVEFVNVEDAGKVGMARIDCSTIGPDCRIGDAGALMAVRPKPKQGAGLSTAPAHASKSSAVSMRPAQAGVSRPTQRGGKRGGLGFKRGGIGAGPARSPGGDTEMSEGGAAAKSNADFRAMFVKSTEVGQAENGQSGDAA